VQFAQLRFARFVFGKFDEVAAFQKFAEAFLLFGQQQIRGLQFVQKFLGRAFRRAEIKLLLEVSADGIGNQNAKRLGLGNERERFFQFLLRANVRRHRRFHRNL